MATRYFHGSFSSADASGLTETNSRFSLYAQGTVTAETVAATEKVVITDLFVSSAGAIVVTVYDGADATVDAGEVRFRRSYAANTSDSPNINTPIVCQVGTYPKVKTSGAGQVELQIRGYIES